MTMKTTTLLKMTDWHSMELGKNIIGDDDNNDNDGGDWDHFALRPQKRGGLLGTRTGGKGTKE